MSQAITGLQRRCPATTRASHPATSGFIIRLIPTVEEIVAFMRTVGEKPDGPRLRGLMVLLWRAGLRVGEALTPQKPILTVHARRRRQSARRLVSPRALDPLSRRRASSSAAATPAAGNLHVVRRRSLRGSAQPRSGPRPSRACAPPRPRPSAAGRPGRRTRRRGSRSGPQKRRSYRKRWHRMPDRS